MNSLMALFYLINLLSFFSQEKLKMIVSGAILTFIRRSNTTNEVSFVPEFSILVSQGLLSG